MGALTVGFDIPSNVFQKLKIQKNDMKVRTHESHTTYIRTDNPHLTITLDYKSHIYAKIHVYDERNILQKIYTTKKHPSEKRAILKFSQIRIGDILKRIDDIFQKIEGVKLDSEWYAFGEYFPLGYTDPLWNDICNEVQVFLDSGKNLSGIKKEIFNMLKTPGTAYFLQELHRLRDKHGTHKFIFSSSLPVSLLREVSYYPQIRLESVGGARTSRKTGFFRLGSSQEYSVKIIFGRDEVIVNSFVDIEIALKNNRRKKLKQIGVEWISENEWHRISRMPKDQFLKNEKEIIDRWIEVNQNAFDTYKDSSFLNALIDYLSRVH